MWRQYDTSANSSMVFCIMWRNNGGPFIMTIFGIFLPYMKEKIADTYIL